VTRPNIGCFIPTPGRLSLLRTLNSIKVQGLLPGDDIIIVGDGYHQPSKDVVDMFGPPFRYVATQKTRTWGHDQCNYGVKHVMGDYIVAQDDDDIFLPRAFDEMRSIAGKLPHPKPIIGRVMTPFLGMLWTAPGQEPLDGHVLVVPNDKTKLGFWGREYAGDQKWLSSSLQPYEEFVWADRCWTLTRPTMKLWPRLSPARPNTENEVWYNFHRDEDGIWEKSPLILLHMWREPEAEHWFARIAMQRTSMMSIDEYEEVIQWAAWAGQGSDVWFRVAEPQKKSPLLPALRRSGYTTHIKDEEYCFEWPPGRTFEPREEL